MINLIPKEEKAKIIKGSYYRLIVLFLLAASAVFFIALVAIFPSYLLSTKKNSIIDSKLEIQKKELFSLPDQKTLAIMKDLNSKLDLIEKDKSDQFIVTEKVINSIIVKKMPNIKITNIAYEYKPEIDPLLGKKISIQGTAPSREVLLVFRRALEDSAFFKQIDLPISNFVKGSNIQFYLSLIPS